MSLPTARTSTPAETIALGATTRGFPATLQGVVDATLSTTAGGGARDAVGAGPGAGVADTGSGADAAGVAAEGSVRAALSSLPLRASETTTATTATPTTRPASAMVRKKPPTPRFRRVVHEQRLQRPPRRA